MDEHQVYAAFGLDDLIEQDNRSKALLKIGFGIVCFVLWLANAWTTGEFFRTYGQAIGAQFGSEVAPLFAFLFGVIIIDVAYIAWLFFPVRVADAAEQLWVGIGTAVLLFLLSLTATGVYISLTNELAQNWLADEAVIRTLSIAGTVIFAFSLSINAIGLLLWQVLAAGWKRARTLTEMRALVLERRAEIDKERAEKVTRQTISTIRQEMNAAADALAQENRRRYLEGVQMGSLPAPANKKDPADGIGFRLINTNPRPQLDQNQILDLLRNYPDFFEQNRKK